MTSMTSGSRSRRGLTWVVAGVALAVVLLLVTRAPAPEPPRSAAPTPSPTSSPSPTPDAPTPDELFVAATGDDAGPGTSAQPLRSITAAAERAQPGTTVHVAPGQYPPAVTAASGTSYRRVRYVSDVRWGALISGGATVPWTNTGSYVDIEGFDVTAPQARQGLLSFGSHVRFIADRAHDVALDSGCDERGGGGIVHAEYRRSSGNEVLDSWVRNVGPPGRCNTIQGIYLSQPDGRVVNNVVSRVSAWCIQTWHAATHITIANNLVFDCGSGTRGGGIVVGAGDRPGGVRASWCTVSNNLVLDSVRGISEIGSIGPGNRYVANLLHGNVINTIALRAGTQQGTLYAAPTFVDFRSDGTGDYHLLPSSAGVAAGSALGAPATDITGHPRPVGRAPDIGPYEG